MKKNNYLLFVLAMLATFSLVGQTSGGPDAYGYTWKSQADTAQDAPNYNWIDISTIGTTVTGLGDDDFVGPLNIGFDFPYYWFTYNSLYIGSNGYVSFDPILIASSGTLAFPNIPTTNTENMINPNRPISRTTSLKKGK